MRPVYSCHRRNEAHHRREKEYEQPEEPGEGIGHGHQEEQHRETEQPVVQPDDGPPGQAGGGNAGQVRRCGHDDHDYYHLREGTLIESHQILDRCRCPAARLVDDIERHKREESIGAVNPGDGDQELLRAGDRAQAGGDRSHGGRDAGNSGYDGAAQAA